MKFREITAYKVLAQDRIVCLPPVKGKPIKYVDGYVLKIGGKTMKLHKEEASQLVSSIIGSKNIGREKRF